MHGRDMWLEALYKWTRPLLFRLPAETAHHLGLAFLRMARGELRAWQPPENLRQKLFGRVITSPIGLAAGFDKDALCLPAWPHLGFGFVEVGTVTPRAQPGSPKPRLFRLESEKSLQNWMGFNGRGVQHLQRRLRSYRGSSPVGVNIGKNAQTAIEDAADDYLDCLRNVDELCDFVVVNVSSPNTEALRSLQQPERLQGLLGKLVEASSVPILIKLSPDESNSALTQITDLSVDLGCRGIVVSNTTVDYKGYKGGKIEHKGGLSGRVLRDRAAALTQLLGRHLRGRATLISVGGIDSAEDAYRRIRAGASLVEVYTGLIYGGPYLPRRLASGLAEFVDRDGYASIQEAVGADL